MSSILWFYIMAILLGCTICLIAHTKIRTCRVRPYLGTKKNAFRNKRAS